MSNQCAQTDDNTSIDEIVNEMNNDCISSPIPAEVVSDLDLPSIHIKHELTEQEKEELVDSSMGTKQRHTEADNLSNEPVPVATYRVDLDSTEILESIFDSPKLNKSPFKMRIHVADRKKPAAKKFPYKCPSCPYKTNQEQDLSRHAICHMGQEKTYRCSLCPYTASLSRNLRRHEKTHTSMMTGNLHKCSICSFSCVRLSSLKRHEITHSGEKPYPCSVCDFRASRKDHLKEHERNHSGEKPFSCSKCSYKAAFKHLLKRHELTHIGGKPFKCPHCPYRTTRKEHVKRHSLRKHSEKAANASPLS